MFKKSMNALGTLTRDEIYAFKLPLAMGGNAGVKNMQKAKLRETRAVLSGL